MPASKLMGGKKRKLHGVSLNKNTPQQNRRWRVSSHSHPPLELVFPCFVWRLAPLLARSRPNLSIPTPLSCILALPSFSISRSNSFFPIPFARYQPNSLLC